MLLPAILTGMSASESTSKKAEELFRWGDWYHRSIDWDARLAREIPVLAEALGQPGDGGIIDAGCGPARQACQLAQRGYRVIAADPSEEMLSIGRALAEGLSVSLDFRQATYEQLPGVLDGLVDGIYCIGNSLAASGNKAVARDAIASFGECLRPGGRLFIQIVNFARMKAQAPFVRGPKLLDVDGVEYLFLREFQFHGDLCYVTHFTLFQDDGWKKRVRASVLYPMVQSELASWCEVGGLHVDEWWGDYSQSGFAVDDSEDLILLATKL